jgi:NhaP-type Na+/H+ or K+/H+ antiporter
VAAFAAGLLFAARDRGLPPEALHTTEDVATLLAMCVWFVFGQEVDKVLRAGVPLEVVVYAVLALTVVRIIPVVLALRGTTIRRRDAIFIGWMGPRGLASLVFGLLAAIALSGRSSTLAAEVTVITVLLSVILHGLTAGPIAAAFARRAAKESEPAAAIDTVTAGQ